VGRVTKRCAFHADSQCPSEHWSASWLSGHHKQSHFTDIRITGSISTCNQLKSGFFAKCFKESVSEKPIQTLLSVMECDFPANWWNHEGHLAGSMHRACSHSMCAPLRDLKNLCHVLLRGAGVAHAHTSLITPVPQSWLVLVDLHHRAARPDWHPLLLFVTSAGPVPRHVRAQEAAQPGQVSHPLSGGRCNEEQGLPQSGAPLSWSDSTPSCRQVAQTSLVTQGPLAMPRALCRGPLRLSCAGGGLPARLDTHPNVL